MAIVSSLSLADVPQANGNRRVTFVFVFHNGEEYRHGPMEFPEGYDYNALREQLVPGIEELVAQREIEANMSEVLEQ